MLGVADAYGHVNRYPIKASSTVDQHLVKLVHTHRAFHFHFIQIYYKSDIEQEQDLLVKNLSPPRLCSCTIDIDGKGVIIRIRYPNMLDQIGDIGGILKTVDGLYKLEHHVEASRNT